MTKMPPRSKTVEMRLSLRQMLSLKKAYTRVWRHTCPCIEENVYGKRPHGKKVMHNLES